MINRKQQLSGILHLKLYYGTHPQLLWKKAVYKEYSIKYISVRERAGKI